jgi:hypothetical protein
MVGISTSVYRDADNDIKRVYNFYAVLGFMELRRKRLRENERPPPERDLSGILLSV